MRTALVERQIADQARAHGLPEERVLEPEEVAAAAAWLLGPDGRAFGGSRS